MDDYKPKESLYEVVTKPNTSTVFRCLLCSRTLSSKQRVLSHLHSAHDRSPVKRVKKLYLSDPSIPVPKRTLYSWQASGQATHKFHQELDPLQKLTPTIETLPDNDVEVDLATENVPVDNIPLLNKDGNHCLEDFQLNTNWDINVAGDMLFQDGNFDIAQVIKYFKLKKGELAIYYEMDKTEKTETRGIVEVCQSTNRIERFLEKPTADQTSSRLASVVFYCFQKQSLDTVSVYLKDRAHMDQRGFGSFMEWLVNQTPVYGMKLPTGFQLIGQVGLSDYEKWVAYFSKITEIGNKCHPYTARAYARIGLMGNPSDGFNGKTISMSIANFWAEVTIQESSQLVLVPHPLNDPTEFGSLGDLHGISRKEGYLGGLRLLQATCKKFYQYCYIKGIALAKKNFTLKYDTNIPRQVGLAGSSAIVTATLRCLMNFYNITDKDIPKALQPKFVLDVEMDELFIQAGLQDRVIQVYEGLVYMDFNSDLIKQQGHGNYVNLDVDCAPNLWLAYHTDPSDSGKIHSNVRMRWNQGDPAIIEAMQQFAELTDLAKTALLEKDFKRLSELMDKNFDLRRSIYGDEALGQMNLKMIELARKYGSSAKFPGSGGAIIGLSQDQRQFDELRRAFQAEGFVICDIVPYSPRI